MDPLVPLEVMVSVETLGALITFERAFVERCLRLTVQLLHLRSNPAVETILHVAVHAMRKASDNRHLSVGTMDVRHDRAR